MQAAAPVSVSADQRFRIAQKTIFPIY